MRNNSSERVANTPPTNWNWVDPQVLATKSTIRSWSHIALNPPSKLLQPNVDPKTVTFAPCTDSNRVCFSRVDKAGGEFFYVYSILFTDFGLRLPFSDFQVQILNKINAAPTQLHPSAWLLVICFELLCHSYALFPTLSTFFYFFQLAGVDDNGGKKTWIHIQARYNKIFAEEERSYNFNNLFFRVQGGSVSCSVPFFMDENRKPKFPLHWSNSVWSPNSPAYSSLSGCDRDLVNKLVELKTPTSCAALISRNDNTPVLRQRLAFSICKSGYSSESKRHPIVDLNVLDELKKGEDKEEEEKEDVSASSESETESRKRSCAAGQRKKQKNSADPLSPEQAADEEEEEEEEQGRNYEGGRRNASVWDRRFDTDRLVRQQLFFCGDQGKLRRIGHVEVGRALKAESLRMAVGVEFLTDQLDTMQKEVFRLTSELQEEKKRRIISEGQSQAEKIAREKAERELAAAREESECTRRRVLEWKNSVALSFHSVLEQVPFPLSPSNGDPPSASASVSGRS